MNIEQTERDSIAAAHTHEHLVKKMLAEAGQDLDDAVHDYIERAEGELQRICRLAQSDPREAGIWLAQWTEDAARASARWKLGDDDRKALEPYKPTRRPVDDFLKTAADICSPYRPGGPLSELERSVLAARGAPVERSK